MRIIVVYSMVKGYIGIVNRVSVIKSVIKRIVEPMVETIIEAIVEQIVKKITNSPRGRSQLPFAA